MKKKNWERETKYGWRMDIERYWKNLKLKMRKKNDIFY